MPARGDGGLARLRALDAAGAVRLLAALSTGGLVAVLLGLSVVAVAAETSGRWTHLLWMERVIAAWTPVAVALAAVALLAGFGVVLVAPAAERDSGDEGGDGTRATAGADGEAPASDRD